MADIGSATVRVSPNMTGIQGKIAAGFKGSAGPATAALGDEVNSSSGPFSSAISKLGDVAKVGGAAIAGGISAGVAGLAALTGKALMAGADLEQNLGGSEAVFEQYAGGIKQAAEDAFSQAGLSQNEFLEGANKMGSLYQGAGFSVQDSMKMTQDSIQRASDVASIMGIDTSVALEAVTGAAKGNFTMMDNLGVAINDTTLGQYALSKGITKSTADMTTQEKVGLANQLFMEKTAKYAGNYAKENQSLSGSINSTKKAFDNLLSGQGDISGFTELLVNTIQLAVPQIVKILPTLVQGIGATLKALVPALGEALPVLIPALITAVQQLLTALVAALPTVIKTLLQALPMFIDAFIQIFLAIVYALPEIISIIANALPTVITALVNGLTSPDALSAIIMGAIQLLLAILQAIPIIIPALVGAIPIIIKNLLDTLTDPMFIAAMMNAGVQLLKATISGIYSIISSVISAAWEIIKAIGGVLSPSSLLDIGKNMVKGLWNGIQDMGGWLKDKIVGFVKDKIPGPIKSALGIHSPSRVAAALGMQVPAGLAQGIESTSGLVSKAATDMANNAIASIGGSDMSASMNVNAAGSAAFAPGLPIAGGGGTVVNNSFTGNIMLGSDSAVREWFRQLNRDTINVSNGLTPLQGAM